MTTQPGTWLATAQSQLLTLAGGFLRNTRHIEGVTCGLCMGMPGEGWNDCRDCRAMMRRDDLSDRLGFATYAIKGQQSGYTMHGYKNPNPGPTHWTTVQLLAGVSLHRHWDCLTSPTHGRPTHWATVPSLGGRVGDHPLEQIVAPILANLTHHPMSAAQTIRDPRGIHPENFVTTPLDEVHVLLVDDTWTRGGHVQSVAAALKQAGAGFVTTFVLARWIDPQWDNTASVIREHLSGDFDPNYCPFTGALCSSG